MSKLPKKTLKHIDALVKHYESNNHYFQSFAKIVHDLLKDDQSLSSYVHSLKYRVKCSGSLRDKLIRKAEDALERKCEFLIDKNNLFEKVTDLAGVRLIHLHTEQMEKIDPILTDSFDHQMYELVEPQFAYTWDNERKEYFKGIGIKTKEKERVMYTSVHYVVAANTRTKERCEIQVRTLMEEVWGEVNHQINYPNKASSKCCGEQLKVLARLTSSCTRLVDSIFTSYEEHQSSNKHTGKN